VDIGDVVKKDDLLFALDDTDLQADRASRLTDIEGTQLALNRAKRSFERNEELHSSSLISEETYEDSKTDLDIARNTLEKAQRALQTVDVQLTKTRIKAPFDCTVLTRPVSAGQAVSGSAGFNAGTEVMTIANLKNMLVAAHVNQSDVVRMKAGQTVDIELEAVPGLNFQGVVNRIAPQATIKNNIKGFAVEILLTNIDPRVRPGMTANLSIPLASVEHVLAVPLAAVFTDQSGRYAYVKTPEGFASRPIQIGIVDFQYAEVVNGLSAGEVVSLVRPDPSEEAEGTNARSSIQPAAAKPTAINGINPTNTAAGTNRVTPSNLLKAS
jgi:RND family efflux transporter MFP subunit